MRFAWRGLLLCATSFSLMGCDWEELRRATDPASPTPPPETCAAMFVPMGRTQVYVKLGGVADRRIELFVNEARIWSSEFPEEAAGWAAYQNGVLRYLSFEDFEELRLEERDADGILLRPPLSWKILNGDSTGSGGCGDPLPRPSKIFFEFPALDP